MDMSIVLPCYNEEQNITNTVNDVSSWMQGRSIGGEIIVVNDGSTDGTGRVLESLKASHPNLRVIDHHRNSGYGAAVRTGCDSATMEIIGFMDSDGQFHAEDFDALLPYLSQFSFVTGRRKHRADPFMRKMNAKLFGLLSFVVLGIWVRDINCALKVFTKETWKRVRPTHSTGALVNAEVFYNLKRQNIPWHQVDVSHYPRVHGTQTGANLSVILNMFREMLALKRSK